MPKVPFLQKRHELLNMLQFERGNEELYFTLSCLTYQIYVADTSTQELDCVAECILTSETEADNIMS